MELGLDVTGGFIATFGDLDVDDNWITMGAADGKGIFLVPSDT